MNPDTREWVRVSRSPSGMTVTTTQQLRNATAKWTVKVYNVKGAIRDAVGEGRRECQKVLAEALEVLEG